MNHSVAPALPGLPMPGGCSATLRPPDLGPIECASGSAT